MAETFICAKINDKVQPFDRWKIYADPLQEWLETNHFGTITGGGTFLEETGEIAAADLEICLDEKYANRELFTALVKFLEERGAPKGSELILDETEENIPFGIREGFALYLNGVDLDPEIYEQCSFEDVVEEIEKLTGISSESYRVWHGPSETAIYLYSTSFDKIQECLKEFLANYPLCKLSRISRVA